MKNVLFDTSVLVAALVDSHLHHEKSFDWLQKVYKKELTGLICTHSLAELYSVLTTLPIQKSISTNKIYKLIETSILSCFKIVDLTKSDYEEIIKTLADNNVRGGATYDALIAYAAYKGKADVLLTFNTSHFKRVFPPIAQLVQEPS